MAQGQQLVAPEDRAGLHPLLVPLARQAGGNGAAAVTCLLRWPEGSAARVSLGTAWLNCYREKSSA